MNLVMSFTILQPPLKDSFKVSGLGQRAESIIAVASRKGTANTDNYIHSCEAPFRLLFRRQQDTCLYVSRRLFTRSRSAGKGRSAPSAALTDSVKVNVLQLFGGLDRLNTFETTLPRRRTVSAMCLLMDGQDM